MVSGDLLWRWGQLRWMGLDPGALLKADKRMGETVKEEQSLRAWGNARGAAAGGSPWTSASPLGTASPCPLVFPLGTWHFQLLGRCILRAGGRLHSPALFPEPSEEAQKDLPRDAARWLLGAGRSPQCRFCLSFSRTNPSLLLLVALGTALLLGLNHPVKIKAFVLKSVFTFEYHNFQWENTES